MKRYRKSRCLWSNAKQVRHESWNQLNNTNYESISSNIALYFVYSIYRKFYLVGFLIKKKISTNKWVTTRTYKKHIILNYLTIQLHEHWFWRTSLTWRYESKPCTLDDFKDAIRAGIALFNEELLQRVHSNFLNRIMLHAIKKTDVIRLMLFLKIKRHLFTHNETFVLV